MKAALLLPHSVNIWRQLSNRHRNLWMVIFSHTIYFNRRSFSLCWLLFASYQHLLSSSGRCKSVHIWLLQVVLSPCYVFLLVNTDHLKWSLCYSKWKLYERFTALVFVSFSFSEARIQSCSAEVARAALWWFLLGRAETIWGVARCGPFSSAATSVCVICVLRLVWWVMFPL